MSKIRAGEEGLIEFDPDLPPNNIYSREVARLKGLSYDRFSGVYRDEDGRPVRDRCGLLLKYKDHLHN